MAKNSSTDQPIQEIYNDEDDNPVELAEIDAVKEQDFSEPEWLQDPQKDSGIEDEEEIYAVLTQEGAGADIKPEEVQRELGTHEEEIVSPRLATPKADEEV